MRTTRGSAVFRLGVALAVLAGAGCIEARRQAGDTTTTDTSDLVEADGSEPDSGDDSTISNDLVQVDTGEVEPDGVVHECDENNDCEPEAQDGCISWECIGFRCVNTPKDDVPCSDGNACTEGEMCDEGVCEGGDAIDCEPVDDQCWENTNTTCDPITGCGLTARPRGTVCDDDNGPDAGSCDKGWRTPEDTCDGFGQCVDRSALIPNDTIHPLAGPWQLVLSTAPTGRAGVTVRAIMTFDNEGGLVFSRVVRSATGFDGVSEGNGGSYCTSVTGETFIDLSGIELVATADKAGEVMILAEADTTRSERIHGVAIRGNGALNAVTGTYRMVSTALYPGTPGQLMTWQGHLGFDNGCINDAGALSTGGGLGLSHSFDVSVSACFFAAEGGQRLLARLIPIGAATPGDGLPIQWTGAIGGRGDIILLTRDDGGLRYGIIVLVKDQAIGRANLFGEFGFVSVRGGIGSSGQVAASILPSLERGVIDYRTGSQVGGGLSTGGAVGPGWWWTAADGNRYAHRIAFGPPALEHSGWVARSDAFLMGWRVAPPSTLAMPQPLDLTPLEGSLFLGVKRTDYRSIAARTAE